MSFSDRTKPSRAFAGAALCALLALAGCTAGPLYATTPLAPAASGQAPGSLAELRGRVAISPAPDRTTQLVRNELDFALNGGTAVRDPLYELQVTARGLDQNVSLQSGTGVPTAGLFRLTADYVLVRRSDGQTVASGSRFGMAPYDRNDQLFASQRAVLDARERAAGDAVRRIVLALTPVLRREAAAAGVPRA